MSSPYSKSYHLVGESQVPWPGTATLFLDPFLPRPVFDPLLIPESKVGIFNLHEDSIAPVFGSGGWTSDYGFLDERTQKMLRRFFTKRHVYRTIAKSKVRFIFFIINVFLISFRQAPVNGEIYFPTTRPFTSPLF